MKTALTIAGSDPTGGAGIQMDLKVFRSLGLHGLSVTAALTAQNSTGVSSVYPVESTIINEQLRVLISDIRPDALKTGMLLTPEAVEAAADLVELNMLGNLVIDPVLRSSSGAEMLRNSALDMMRSRLLPLADVATPNIKEASALSGIEIKNENDIRIAAEKIIASGCKTVIITGGHFDEISRLSECAPDLFYDGIAFRTIETKRINGEFHGTGCAYSAAITGFIAKGFTVFEAAERAKEFIIKAITESLNIGKGMKYLNV
ncbi:MAG: bifunctional hydroxymethylpyrimidine kinase/phosphomethylpyrimidine kinase [Dissulfurispiraceae bacterium]|jgi:hydroxymethylpyrimidine/phosphomethylpyrimidine kinase|nr:bifunctional hydroxymethylpyrimidine kinase/phosphomethylpyrimidine kinase [Dissulfurispiraceae bacterium]